MNKRNRPVQGLAELSVRVHEHFHAVTFWGLKFGANNFILIYKVQVTYKRSV